MTQAGGRLRIVAIGRHGTGPEAELVARYAARMTPRLEILALADGIGSATEIKRREAESILRKITHDERMIALDLDGEAPDSTGLSRRMAQWRESARSVTFVIGGAEGLDRSVLDRADAVLSLGRLTLPHMLARVVLVEQLYRAQCILAGHPYHRSGRP